MGNLLVVVVVFASFFIHFISCIDINGDGYLDTGELEALFVKEVGILKILSKYIIKIADQFHLLLLWNYMCL